MTGIEGIIIEYSVDGHNWIHGRTCAGWVRDHPGILSVQREIVREQVKERLGNVRVVTRWLDEDDERAEVNRLPSNGDTETERLVARFMAVLQHAQDNPDIMARIENLIDEIEDGGV